MGVPDANAVDFEATHLRLLDERAHPTTPEHVRYRRFLATKPISDDDHVELLAPVRASMRREGTFGVRLAFADGATALFVTLLASVAWGVAFTWVFMFVPVVAVLISKVQGLYDRDDMVLRKSTVGEWRNVLRASVITAIAAYLSWWSTTAPSHDHGLRVFGYLVAGDVPADTPGSGSGARDRTTTHLR